MKHGTVLADFLVNAGEHPEFGEPWWQIAFDFGRIQVSIARTPYSDGVELMAYGLADRPLVRVTPALAVMVLDQILDSLVERSEL